MSAVGVTSYPLAVAENAPVPPTNKSITIIHGLTGCKWTGPLPSGCLLLDDNDSDGDTAPLYRYMFHKGMIPQLEKTGRQSQHHEAIHLAAASRVVRTPDDISEQVLLLHRCELKRIHQQLSHHASLMLECMERCSKRIRASELLCKYTVNKARTVTSDLTGIIQSIRGLCVEMPPKVLSSTMMSLQALLQRVSEPEMEKLSNQSIQRIYTTLREAYESTRRHFSEQSLRLMMTVCSATIKEALAMSTRVELRERAAIRLGDVRCEIQLLCDREHNSHCRIIELEAELDRAVATQWRYVREVQTLIYKCQCQQELCLTVSEQLIRNMRKAVRGEMDRRTQAQEAIDTTNKKLFWNELTFRTVKDASDATADIPSPSLSPPQCTEQHAQAAAITRARVNSFKSVQPIAHPMQVDILDLEAELCAHLYLARLNMLKYRESCLRARLLFMQIQKQICSMAMYHWEDFQVGSYAIAVRSIDDCLLLFNQLNEPCLVHLYGTSSRDTRTTTLFLIRLQSNIEFCAAPQAPFAVHASIVCPLQVYNME